jgi:methionyl-tRNA synthetase
LEELLREWLTSHWLLSDKVKSYSLAWVTSGLKPRALTRDTGWGIPAPFEGAEDKTVYVWFDALLGYISATKEYFITRGRPDEWLKLWSNSDTMTAYFIGKDNIPFHAVIFPALIIASGRGYKLPDVISATEYLLYEGEKFSKSRRIGIWADEALEIFGEVEYWRFALMRMRPEDRDTSFKWSEFIRIVNTELNDDIGNFVHRVLTLIWRYFNGVVPELSALSGEDEAALRTLRDSWLRYCKHMELGEIRRASEVVVELARFGNQYITKKAPWFKIKEDVNDVKTTLRISFEIGLHIAVMLYPLMPKISRTLLDIMGVEAREELVVGEAPTELFREGHRIKEPKVVFTKIPKDLAEALLDPEKREDIVRSARERANTRRPPILRF